jgi:SAM-dependent methyltransferase
MKQDDVFWNSEGDAWFKRNDSTLHRPEKVKTDIPLNLILKLGIVPRKVLEIGASNGYRLAEIAKQFDAQCIGVEPSEAAIADGKKLFPNIELRRGLASKLPLEAGESFDLVIVHFILHWISRETLLHSIAEIDRAVSDRGFLLVGDFLPDYPTKVPYHHLPNEEVYTFKMDYAGIFLATGIYTLCYRVTYHHEHPDVVCGMVPSGNRAVCSVLRKSLQEFYSLGYYNR